MMRQMPSRLLTEWMAYRNLEPFGDELLDIHLANLSAILVNANRKKGSAAIKPQRFRLWKAIRTFDAQGFYENLKTALTMNPNPSPNPPPTPPEAGGEKREGE